MNSASGSGRSLALRFASLVKFEHTVFALPFAGIGAVVADGGIPDLRTILLILAAMVGARTAAMTYNRIADLDVDRVNPRTARRELVTGEVGAGQAWVLLAVSCGPFVYAAYMLNMLAFTLSPLALFVILGYSWTKRFTSLSHVVLGLALSIAPAGAWIAVTGEIDTRAFILAAAVVAWTAGFDIIYSLQDTEFDREQRLHSLPAAIGEESALHAARALHAIMVLLLVWFGKSVGLGSLYVIGVFLVGAFLVWEHSLVSVQDKSRINVAFFTMNGVVSIVLFVFTLLDILLGGW